MINILMADLASNHCNLPPMFEGASFSEK